MSKAFTREDLPEAGLIVITRAQLPPGVPNYTTTRGFEFLREERDALLSARRDAIIRADHGALPNLDANLSAVEGRIASAEIIQVPSPAPKEVRFGAAVRVLDEEDRTHSFEIVGVDEANLERGKIAFIAPLARALLGKRQGDTALVRTPRGEEEFEILSVSYPSP